MQNVIHRVTGSKLTIEIDLSPKALSAAVPSSTGKTLLLASTNGKVELPPVNGRAVSFALNVMLRP